ncbi:MAG: family 20 glycosylhydrolase [Mucilaginibacter sp.]
MDRKTMRKTGALLWLVLLAAFSASAQIRPRGTADTSFSTFYRQRSSLFRLLPITKNDVIFLGNSITNGNEWDELFADSHIKNRGISGDVTAGVLNRLDEVTARKPEKVFLLIGINDLAHGSLPDSAVRNVFTIVRRVHEESPATRIYVESILPVNNHFKNFPTHVTKSLQVKQADSMLRVNANGLGYRYIDLYPFFCDKNGQLDTLYTNDGLHEKGTGYMLWKHLIYPYVYDLQSKPSIVPQPRSLQWTNERFPLYSCRYIVAGASGFEQQARYLQQAMIAKGWPMQVLQGSTKTPCIVLKHTGSIPGNRSDEAYQLAVAKDSVLITASTSHGCFNAIQTLLQLMRDNTMVPGVNITDSPAFSWRGYMIDVGRNFQSIDLLKQQMDMMARYKLNVFHLHLTEDIAWRLYINAYPQLTAAGNMLRNKGAFYTPAQLKELIAYCKERFIEFVPEIDMPGHSGAFKRAFSCDMQSDSGMVILKNIIREICDTYDFRYLHIGGDEVKITNSRFLPEMSRYIRSFNKQLIGWSPGGNLDSETIRQLWMKEGPVSSRIRYIDSRNLYINHMDPLESVPAIFNRQLDDVGEGDYTKPGAELCLWPDRNVTTQQDIFRMNPVYPAMLAFAERSWQGGGKSGWRSVATDDTAFREFENRLTDQEKEYFHDIPFPYVAQSGMHWQLFGPYNNKGHLDKSFPPELPGFHGKPKQTVTGATVVLRHFWHPAVRGVLSAPKDSTTWYAASTVIAPADTTASFWVGFYDISRSVNTATPALNCWDSRESRIWINGNLMPPPDWARAGGKGDAEQPLIDEGYTYRPPLQVHLHKGLNKILVKLPVGSFNGPSWQMPVKWMFTAVFVKPFGVNYVTDEQLYTN